jgi:hypothetical protein
MFGKWKLLTINAALFCGLISTSASAEFLKSGQSLRSGQSMASHDGRYTATMQTDGNLVVYRNSDRVAIWNTGTEGSGAVTANMQADGNFVLYTAQGMPAWQTGTSWQAGSLPNEFTVDDQGLAVVVSFVPVWTSGVSIPGLPPAQALDFQAGFMFQQGVVYNGPNGITWTFQSDGNLVMYHGGGVVWASNVIKNKSGKAIYAVWNGVLSTWNDSGEVWNGAGTRTYPPGFVFDGDQATLHLAGDGSVLEVEPDGNLYVWSAARKWAASSYDPAPLPPASGPHCIGDPHACANDPGIGYTWSLPF